MTDQPSHRHMHLFHKNVLVANVQTRDLTPAESYDVDGIRYQCISYLQVVEQTGNLGFDVQVEILAD